MNDNQSPSKEETQRFLAECYAELRRTQEKIRKLKESNVHEYIDTIGDLRGAIHGLHDRDQLLVQISGEDVVQLLETIGTDESSTAYFRLMDCDRDPPTVLIYLDTDARSC